MGIENTQNRISSSTTDRSTSQKDINPKPSQEKTIKPDLSDLHEAAQDFENKIEAIGEKYKTKKAEKKVDAKNIGFFERFLHDDWPIRTYFALGNEIAECFKELAHHILPKPIAKTMYAGLWSLAGVSTGTRVVQNYKNAPKEHATKSGFKMLVHDGISALGAPTIVANVMNAIQNALYKFLPLPTTIKHLARSIVSIIACKHTIHALDPHAKAFSQKMTGINEDRHHEVNKALGNQHGSDKAHKAVYSQAA